MSKLEHLYLSVHVPPDGTSPGWKLLNDALNEDWEIYWSEYAEHQFHFILRRVK